MFRIITVRFKLILLTAVVFVASSFVPDAAKPDTTSAESQIRVYVYDIRKEIAKPAWWVTQKAFKEAEEWKADYIILHLNTYGGQVNYADSIRTKILNSSIPVIGFIDNQAISAGALISIACDSLFIRSGGSIGAATVVDQSGNVVPDK